MYEGNKNDITGFEEYTALLKKRMPDWEPGSVTLVFDGGSVSQKNMDNLGMHYICRDSLSRCKDLYDVGQADFQDFEFSGKKVRCHRTERIIWGRRHPCVITISDSLKNGQINELEKNMEKAVGEMDGLNIRMKNPRSPIYNKSGKTQELLERILKKYEYSAEILQPEIKDNEICREIKEEEKTSIILRYFGKKLIITEHEEWRTEEILKSYYEQDCIEKIFRDSKNVEHCSLRPIYHWTNAKIKTHIFICMLGLMLARILQKMVLKEMDISTERMLDVLGGIWESWVKESSKDKKVIRKMEEMTLEQEKIWKLIQKI